MKNTLVIGNHVLYFDLIFVLMRNFKCTSPSDPISLLKVAIFRNLSVDKCRLFLSLFSSFGLFLESVLRLEIDRICKEQTGRGGRVALPVDNRLIYQVANFLDFPCRQLYRESLHVFVEVL